MTKRIEKLMLKFGWVPVATMIEAVNKVAADATVDHYATLGERDRALQALEAEKALRTGDIRVVGALMDELAEVRS